MEDAQTVLDLDALRITARHADARERFDRHLEKKKATKNEIDSIEVRLKKFGEEIEDNMHQGMWHEIETEKCKIYKATVTDLRKKKALKSVMFTQNIINYILYVIFVLNIFITSFSLMSEDEGNATNSSTV